MKLLTVKQASEILGVHTKTTYRWLWGGTLPSVRLGPRGTVIRIPKDELERYIEERKS